MTKKELAALNKSIEHWDRLAKGTSTGSECIFANSCALCQLVVKKDEYYDDPIRALDNCYEYCILGRLGYPCSDNGTAWSKVYNIWENLMYPKRSIRFRKAAANMAKFLRDVRKGKVKKRG